MAVDRRDLDRVADLWGRVATDRAQSSIRGWADSPIVLESVVGPRQSASPNRHWLLGLADEIPLPKGGRWLSLGCGAAGTEIFAGRHGLFASLLAMDGSEGALAEGRKAASAENVPGLEFARADLNALDLPASEFDVALMNMSLHHVKNLEGTLGAVERALKPGGIFVVNEFVGPSQFQFTELQLAIADAVLAVLPDRWRMDLTTGKPKTRYARQPRSHWNVVDPSEAIRSDEIVGLLEARFEVVLRRDYGGTILHLALEHIVHNFDRSDERDVAAIRLMGLLEELLIRHGVLESDFTLMALRKAAPGPGRSAQGAAARDGARDAAGERAGSRGREEGAPRAPGEDRGLEGVAARPGPPRSRRAPLVAPRAVRILWVATKPPWPPRDGGRLVAANTIEALAAAGHQVTVVAPSLRGPGTFAPPGIDLHLVPARPLPLALALLAAVIHRVPVSIARHSLPAVRRLVARLLATEPFDVVHAEQAQAVGQCAPALSLGRPVVFRAQNVESDLWAGAASGGLMGQAARREAAQLARWEGAAVGRLAATVALTEDDAARLEALASGRTRVHVVPAPVASELPAAERPLPGDPAVVMMGSSGWLPNRRGAEWFRAVAWPAIRRALPSARLHVFGEGGSSPPELAVESHAAPDESREAFAPGAVLVVPLDLASGVRMKILEAWARGVPVVATAAAAAGLRAEDGRELLLAQGADGFVAALRRLHESRDLGPALTAAGRALLRRRHDPATVAAALAGIYDEASGTKKKS